MSGLGLITRGYVAGVGPPGTGGIASPTISNITPSEDIEPGEPGAFSASFKVARLTPIEFDLTNIPAGADITISVKYEDRNETYTALAPGTGGVFTWPFDVQADNEIGLLSSEPVHVRMLPRGGWPPTVVSFVVAASAIAVTAPVLIAIPEPP